MPQIFPERLAVPVTHALALHRLLTAAGQPYPDGLDAWPAHDGEEGTVPLSQDGRLLQWAEDCGLGSMLGYAAGCAGQPADHGVLGFALMSSPNLGEALAAWTRFAPALAGGFDVRRVIAADRLELHFRDPFPGLPGRSAGLDRFIAFTVQLCRQLGRVPLQVLELRLAPPLLERARAASRRSDLPALHPANAGARLVLPLHCMDTPVASHQPALWPLLLQKCEREAAHAHRPGDWIARVERLLERRLETPLPIEQAARALCVSTRTLKRRLHESNRTYRSVVDDLRRREALLALEDPAVRIEDVALRLGYTDQANFARAFRRWTGEAPGRYRCQTSRRSAPSRAETACPATPATPADVVDGRQAIGMAVPHAYR